MKHLKKFDKVPCMPDTMFTSGEKIARVEVGFLLHCQPLSVRLFQYA